MAYVHDTSIETHFLESMKVVIQFMNVFSTNLLNAPPDRDIDFGIYLDPGSKPISILHYKMATTELKN